VLSAAYRWDQPTLTWLPVATNDTLTAGTVLWLRASTNATVSVTGTYTPPVNSTAPTGPSFQPGAGLEALPLLGERAGVRADVPLWKFDGPSQTWLVRYGTNLPSQSDFPATLAAGDGVMTRSDVPTTLEVPESALRIRYYQEDHLGSSSVVTDTAGVLVSESANYAFGFTRSEISIRASREPYQFTQKEKDSETAYSYFEARYMNNSIGRFMSCDPVRMEMIQSLVNIPQKLNPFLYCLNNPIRLVDPTGLVEGESSATEATRQDTTQRQNAQPPSDANGTPPSGSNSGQGQGATGTTQPRLQVEITGEQTDRQGNRMVVGTFTLTRRNGTTVTGFVMGHAENFAVTQNDAATATQNSGRNRRSGTTPMDVIRLQSETQNGRLRDIHPGNTARDTTGCLLVGSDRPNQGFLGNSRAAFNQIYREFNRGNGGTVTIQDRRIPTPQTPTPQPQPTPIPLTLP
jgi:RHS repeat-associated protein